MLPLIHETTLIVIYNLGYYIDKVYLFNCTGIPLLEENEMLETAEGSNSSVSGGDTGSATYSETSSK